MQNRIVKQSHSSWYINPHTPNHTVPSSVVTEPLNPIQAHEKETKTCQEESIPGPQPKRRANMQQKTTNPIVTPSVACPWPQKVIQTRYPSSQRSPLSIQSIHLRPRWSYGLRLAEASILSLGIGRSRRGGAYGLACFPLATAEERSEQAEGGGYCQKFSRCIIKSQKGSGFVDGN